MSQDTQVAVHNVDTTLSLNLPPNMNRETALSPTAVHFTNKNTGLNPVPSGYSQSLASMLHPSISSSIGSSITETPNVETSVMSMPVAMPLSGLTTIPLALCAMGGAGNIGTGMVNGIPTQPGVPAGGIVLLNVSGTSNTNITAFSQLAACSSQVQQPSQPMVQPVVIGADGNPIGTQALQIQQQNQLPQIQQAQLNAPIMAPVHQVPVPPPAVPQGGATAYMLVPIHQVPQNNQFPQVQQLVQPGVVHQQSLPVLDNATKSPLNATSLQGNLSVPQASFSSQTLHHHHATVPHCSGQTASHQSHVAQTYPASFTIPLSCTQATTVPLQTAPISSAGVEQTGKPHPASTCTTPINDPHISSSVPTNYKGLSSLLTPAVLNEIQKIRNTANLDEEKKQLSGNLANEIFKSLTSEDRSTQPQSYSSNQYSPPEKTSPIEQDFPPPTTFTELFRVDLSSTPPVTVTSSMFSTATTSSIVAECGLGEATPSSNASSSTVHMTDASHSEPHAGPSSPGPTTSHQPPPVREKRKKGPAPKLDGDEVCSVCTDKASGFHYGVLSCEGCKGFFRRSVIKNSSYKCKVDGQCKMDSYTRRKCQFCRLSKCRQAGMKDENVLSEMNGTSKVKRIKKESPSSFMASPRHFAPNLSFSGEPVPSLTSHQRNVVEMLQMNETRYQWPTQEDVAKVTPWLEVGDSHRCRASRFAHFTELSILIVQLVVEFTKQLPGFLTVTREDQILLLKACTIEVMLLRAAKQYDKKSKAINFLNGRYYDKSSFYRAGMQVEFVDPIFDFCESMAKLGLDEAEYALLVAINTFSADRPNLKGIDKVEAVQESYVELLRIYLKIHRPEEPLMFARTLMKLVELRSLNSYHSEQIFALKVQDKQLPPLLAEIWDM